MKYWILGSAGIATLLVVVFGILYAIHGSAPRPETAFNSRVWIESTKSKGSNSPRYAMRKSALSVASKCENVQELERLLGKPDQELNTEESVKAALDLADKSASANSVILCYSMGEEFSAVENTYWTYELRILCKDRLVKSAWS